jgi:hypothetical protein
MLVLCEKGKTRIQPQKKIIQIDRTRLQKNRTRIEVRNLQHLIKQGTQCIDIDIHVLQQALLLRLISALRAQRIKQHGYGLQGLAHIVTGGGKEACFGIVSSLRFFALSLCTCTLTLQPIRKFIELKALIPAMMVKLK